MQGVASDPGRFPRAFREDERTLGDPWFIAPAVDLFLVCGGLMWLLVILRSQFRLLSGHVSDTAFTALVLVGTHAFSDTHVAATLVKVATERKRGGAHLKVVILPAVLAASTLLAGLLLPGALAMMLQAYLMLILHHYCRQTYGIASTYCRRAACDVTRRTKLALSAFFDCLIALATVRIFCEPGLMPKQLLGQELRVWVPFPAVVELVCAGVLLASVLALGWSLVIEMQRARKPFPIASMLLILSTTAFLLSSGETNAALWLFAPAFFHGLQYLVVVFSARGQDGALGVDAGRKAFGDQGSLLLLISVGLYFGLPLSLQLLGVSANVATASVFCTLSFHHFLTDALIWKSPAHR